MELIGYFAAILIGVSLGLIGGGGSILTVPVLVYLFHIDAVVATTYSLFVVGFTSILGSITYFTKKLIDVKIAFLFGLPSIVSVFITRIYLLPLIPDKIIDIGSLAISKSIFLMLLFAILMLLASYKMIQKNTNHNEQIQEKKQFNLLQIILQGLIIGMLTGLVGAGGGFLIIPALVNLLYLPIKKAIGTSLFIISLNSISGFLFSLQKIEIDWIFLFTITSIAAIGIFIGSFLSSKIDGKKLKPAFGWFVLVMGIFILLKEIYLK